MPHLKKHKRIILILSIFGILAGVGAQRALSVEREPEAATETQPEETPPASNAVPADTWWEEYVSGTSTHVYNINNGNVGIGDTTPAAKFVVGNGDKFRVTGGGLVRSVDGTAAAPAYSFVTDNNTGMIRYGEDYLGLVTGGVLRLSASNNGRVGVNVSDPRAMFHIVDPYSDALQLETSSPGTPIRINLKRADSAQMGRIELNYSAFHFQTDRAQYYSFVNSNGELMRLDPTGNLGVGSLAPAKKLHVVGNGIRLQNGTKTVDLRADGSAIDLESTTDNLSIHSSGPNGNNNILLNSEIGQGNVGIGDATPAAKFVVGDGDMFQVSDSGLVATQEGTAVNPAYAFVNGPSTGLHLLGTGGLGVSVGGTDRLTLENDGRITATGDIAGKSKIMAIKSNDNTKYAYLDFDETNSQGLLDVVAGAGNLPLTVKPGNTTFVNNRVGIGTTNPSEALEVVGNAKINGSVSADSIFNSIYGALYLKTQNTHRLAIDSSGNVAIGKTYGDTKFEVVGNRIRLGDGSKIIDLRVDGGAVDLESRTNNLFITSSGPSGNNNVLIQPHGGQGNVGIGTETPDQKLTVNGTIKAREVLITNTDWADDVFEENYALASLDEVESYIKDHGRLPRIPSEEEVKTSGVNVSEIQAGLLRKIEELTLYTIDLEKRLKTVEEKH